MPNKYPKEQRDRATRMALDRLTEYPSAWAAAQALGPKLGVGAETLRKWIVQAQVDGGMRSGPTSEELAEIKRLRSENRDLRSPVETAMSLARRSSFTSLRSSLRSSCSTVVSPGCRPASTSACFTHWRRDSMPTPSWRATRETTP